MPLRALAVTLALGMGAALPIQAATIDDLMAALGLPEMIEIMRTEGLDYGQELGTEMRPGGADDVWQSTVSAIYDAEAMEVTVREGMIEALGDRDLAPIVAFFTAPTGSQIVEMELSARRAMVDADVEQAARDVYRSVGREDPRLSLVQDFVTVNDLVEANVTGALNASFKFYSGMADGGALSLSESEILAIIWDSEPETRADTQEWVYGFLLLAYGPLEDATVETYIDFSRSDAGSALNRALFAGFNDMYNQISYALGRALARDLEVQEL